LITAEKRRTYVRQRKIDLTLRGICHRHPKETLLEGRKGCNKCAEWDHKGDRTSEYANKRRLKNATFMAYGGECACCGLGDQRFLTIDHILNDGKLDKINGRRSGSQLYRYLRRNGYPKDRYQVLCYNCNLAKAHNNGICPHKQSVEGD
jgi:hypothetical protein